MKYSDGTSRVYYDWYYVHNGKVDFSADTLCKYNGSWWYVKNGKVDYDDNTLVKYGNNWYWVGDGRVNWNASYLNMEYKGNYYTVQNGVVVF